MVGWIPYNWGNNGGSTASLSNLCSGVYNVVVTNVNGCSSTGSAVVNASITSCAADLDIYGGQKSSDLLSYATYHPGTSIAIHGDFIIDQDFSFLNSDVAIDDGFKIIVNPGVKLIVLGSSLHACHNFWQGIIISSDASTLIVKQGSSISDAKIGIEASNSAQMSIKDSHFIHNETSIYIHDGNFFFTEIYGNEFYYSDPLDLKDASTIAHIHLQNAMDVIIGATRPTLRANNFYNAYYGIFSESSDVLVQNNEFHNLGHLVLNDAFQWVNIGAAIRGTGASNSIEIRGSGTIADRNYFHGQIGQGAAISLEGDFGVKIYGNVFENIYGGIDMYKVKNHLVDIHSNEFHRFLYGVSAFDLDHCEINVWGNSMNMISTSNDPSISVPITFDHDQVETFMGIDFQGSVNLSTNTYDCHNNWIANAKYATHIRNIEAANLGQVNIQHNQIFFTKDPEKIMGIEKGIWMENSIKVSLNSNHIESKFGTPSPGYEKRLVGIEFTKSTDCRINENYIGEMGYSVFASYDCDHTEFHCNNFDNFGNAIVCKKLIIPIQGNNPPQASWDNEWNGSWFGSWIGGDLAVGQPLDWYYQNAQNQDLLNNSIISSVNPALGIDDPGCSAPIASTPTVLREKNFESTAYGTRSYNEDALFHSYYEKVLFYTGLKKNPTLLNLGTADDILYQTLYNNLDNGNIGQFEKINDLIKAKDFDQANVLLNQIVDENIVELYKKTVSQILIDKEKYQRELTSFEKTTLENIAYEPGIYGGEAVYIARAMLKIFVDDDLSTARRKAPAFFTNKKSETISTITNFIFPNPANKEVCLIFSEVNQYEKNIRILNSVGNVVKYLNWEKNTPIFTVNIEDLSPGVYNVIVTINNEYSKTNKLVVIH